MNVSVGHIVLGVDLNSLPANTVRSEGADPCTFLRELLISFFFFLISFATFLTR